MATEEIKYEPKDYKSDAINMYVGVRDAETMPY